VVEGEYMGILLSFRPHQQYFELNVMDIIQFLLRMRPNWHGSNVVHS
jgi:hypothetical protein